MSRAKSFHHQFVKSAPRELEAGILYVSVEFATALHLCACGCREKVVTPFSPKDWNMSFDGKAISLSPSIGNWSLSCRSHYFIRKGRIQWAGNWTDQQVRQGRNNDRIRKTNQGEATILTQHAPEIEVHNTSLIARVWKLISSKF